MRQDDRRSTTGRLRDVLDAISVIREHLKRGSLDDGLVFDAVRMRFVEIGEVVNALPEDLLSQEEGSPWSEIVGMRHKLAHHYFDTLPEIIASTVEVDLPELEVAIHRLIARVAGTDPNG